MRNIDKIQNTGNIEFNCLPNCSEEAEELVIFELVVPGSAKVPAPRHHVEMSRIMVRQCSVTSTVTGKVLTQLNANNTAAVATGWSITATLAAPRRARRY
jgi:hypothetical protein